MNESYCKGKRIEFEGDKECYYHGFETICPLCGKHTNECKEGTYTKQTSYSLRELGW